MEIYWVILLTWFQLFYLLFLFILLFPLSWPPNILRERTLCFSHNYSTMLFISQERQYLNTCEWLCFNKQKFINPDIWNSNNFHVPFKRKDPLFAEISFLFCRPCKYWQWTRFSLLRIVCWSSIWKKRRLSMCTETFPHMYA